MTRIVFAMALCAFCLALSVVSGGTTQTVLYAELDPSESTKVIGGDQLYCTLHPNCPDGSGSTPSCSQDECGVDINGLPYDIGDECGTVGQSAYAERCVETFGNEYCTPDEGLVNALCGYSYVCYCTEADGLLVCGQLGDPEPICYPNLPTNRLTCMFTECIIIEMDL